MSNLLDKLKIKNNLSCKVPKDPEQKPFEQQTPVKSARKVFILFSLIHYLKTWKFQGACVENFL